MKSTSTDGIFEQVNYSCINNHNVQAVKRTVEFVLKQLAIKPRWGLAEELTKRVYGSVAKRIREPITNALDAGAKNVWITALAKPQPELWITDDGLGMTTTDFEEFYLGLGGSPKADSTEPTIGRIGVGFLAIMALADTVDVFSKKPGQPAFWATLNSRQLARGDLRTSELGEVPIGEINEVLDPADFRIADLGESFTKLRLTGLHPEFIDVLTDSAQFSELQEELSRMLPLVYDVESPTFEKLTEPLQVQLFNLSRDHCLSVFVNGVPLKRRLWGDRSGESLLHVFEVNGRNQRNVRVCGYLCGSDSEIKNGNWRGLTLRVDNVSVEENGFLNLTSLGSGWPRDLITGELHVEGLDKVDAISLDRTSFNYSSRDVQVLRSLVEKIVLDFFAIIQKHKVTMDEIRSRRKSAKALQTTMAYALAEMSKPVVVKQLPAPKATTPSSVIDLEELQRRAPSITGVDLSPNEPTPHLDTSSSGRIVLGKDLEVQVTQGEDGPKYKIRIDTKLVEGRTVVTIDGTDFDVFLVDGDPEEAPAVFDVDRKEIRINRHSPITANFKSEKLMFVLFLEYSYLRSKGSAQAMRDTCMSLLYSQSVRGRPGRKPKV